MNTGAISGGKGGAAGVGNTSGVSGAGGVGIVGSDLIVINSGTISGGLAGNGITRANAITFTGGSNTLTLQSGSSMTGNIEIDGGSITFNQSTAQTLGNVIAGNGSIIQNGTGALTLTGINTYSGGTSIYGGATIVAAGNNALGTGPIAGYNNATLQIVDGVTVNNMFDLEGPATNFNVASGTGTYAGQITEFGDPATLVKTGAGTLVISNNTNKFLAWCADQRRRS
jgi:autotransporter-associated beta strand protein